MLVIKLYVWKFAGTSLDQGIAYVLMLLALLLTYIIHLAELPISL